MRNDERLLVGLGLAAGGAVALLARPSPNITWGEMTTTSTGLPNVPDIMARVRAVFLCRLILEWLIERVGPLSITSGYRSKDVNTAVGGAKNSYHLAGAAADIYDENGEHSHEDLATMLYRSDLPIAECIIERHTGHLHVAVDIGAVLGNAPKRYFAEYDGRSYTAWTPAQ